MVDEVAIGQVFSEYFGFLCQSSFHQFLHNHHHLSWGLYNRVVIAAVPNGLKSNPTNNNNDEEIATEVGIVQFEVYDIRIRMMEGVYRSIGLVNTLPFH
jgi:hypothetical protein